ncbi:sensor histidine kinase GlrK [Serratia symbiotica]|uniref:Sensor histidine kinase GlrK n=1 Tax=Serratia symbiotica TaxID=138074 RepID=A0A455VHH6_9GAMM|nr:sensor histidine kinase GlrK [Serratia symbiotica]
MGLSIAKDCIRRMHGDLQLIMVADADVCFRIELPLTTAENE